MAIYGIRILAQPAVRTDKIVIGQLTRLPALQRLHTNTNGPLPSFIQYHEQQGDSSNGLMCHLPV